MGQKEDLKEIVGRRRAATMRRVEQEQAAALKKAEAERKRAEAERAKTESYQSEQAIRRLERKMADYNPEDDGVEAAMASLEKSREAFKSGDYQRASGVAIEGYVKLVTAKKNEKSAKQAAAAEKKDDNEVERVVEEVTKKLSLGTKATEKPAQNGANVDRRVLEELREKGYLIVMVAGEEGAGKTEICRKYGKNPYEVNFGGGLLYTVYEKGMKGQNGTETKMALAEFEIDDLSEALGNGLRKRYYPALDGAIIVADANKAESVENLPKIYENIRSFAGKEMPAVFLANKIDEADGTTWRAHVEYQLEKVAGKAPHYLTSTYTGEFFETAFEDLVRLIKK